MNLSVTVAMILLLLQLPAAARNICQSIPGLPGRDGRDGRDGTPGVPGPAGPPGTTTEESCFQTLKTASSCKEVYDCNPNSPSGYYWISKDGSPPELMYCGMNLTRCGNITGGWTRVAHFNMTSPVGTCPSPLDTIANPRSCSHSGGIGCSSVNYSTFGINYTQVCGRAIGYQHHSPDAFGGTDMSRSIDSHYVDGLSITFDTPRRHLWTYAAGFSESPSLNNPANCPCSDDHGNQPPTFVQDHYYCESGNAGQSNTLRDQWYTDDPLWDGEGCPTGNTCCDPPNLPWFNRAIDTPSTADIELRLCQDEILSNEDVGLEQFELYVY